MSTIHSPADLERANLQYHCTHAELLTVAQYEQLWDAVLKFWRREWLREEAEWGLVTR